MPSGVIQGDLFSTTLFCLTIMPLLKEAVHLMEQPAGDSDVCGIVKAYADYWQSAESARRVRKVFQYPYTRAPAYGLEMQPNKCSWYPYANPDLRFVPDEKCPGSPAITPPRIKDPRYEQLNDDDECGGVKTVINKIPLGEFEDYYRNQASRYVR